MNVFWYDDECSFEVNHFNGDNQWKPFDIMKHVSLEDKIQLLTFTKQSSIFDRNNKQGVQNGKLQQNHMGIL